MYSCFKAQLIAYNSNSPSITRVASAVDMLSDRLVVALLELKVVA